MDFLVLLWLFLFAAIAVIAVKVAVKAAKIVISLVSIIIVVMIIFVFLSSPSVVDIDKAGLIGVSDLSKSIVSAGNRVTGYVVEYVMEILDNKNESNKAKEVS